MILHIYDYVYTIQWLSDTSSHSLSELLGHDFFYAVGVRKSARRIETNNITKSWNLSTLTTWKQLPILLHSKEIRCVQIEMAGKGILFFIVVFLSGFATFWRPVWSEGISTRHSWLLTRGTHRRHVWSILRRTVSRVFRRLFSSPIRFHLDPIHTSSRHLYLKEKHKHEKSQTTRQGWPVLSIIRVTRMQARRWALSSSVAPGRLCVKKIIDRRQQSTLILIGYDLMCLTTTEWCKHTCRNIPCYLNKRVAVVLIVV